MVTPASLRQKTQAALRYILLQADTNRPYPSWLSLLSTIGAPGTGWGPLLVMDEATHAKNADRQEHKAMHQVRNKCEACIMLTATPLDNTWKDVLSLFTFLRNLPFRSLAAMFTTFTSRDVDKGSIHSARPTGTYIQRLQNMLDACMLRRGRDEINVKTSDACTDEPIASTMDRSQQFRSNDNHEDWARTSGALRPRLTKLALSQQLIMHPQLHKITRLNKKVSQIKRKLREGVPITRSEQHKLHQSRSWQDKMRRSNGWFSPLMAVLESTVRHITSRHPGEGVIIADMSVCFLDIVATMFAATSLPYYVWRYNGRSTIPERDSIIQRFKEHYGESHIPLMTVGTGGQGLNIQIANHLITCSELWKQSATYSNRCHGNICFGKLTARPRLYDPAFEIDVLRPRVSFDTSGVHWST